MEKQVGMNCSCSGKPKWGLDIILQWQSRCNGRGRWMGVCGGERERMRMNQGENGDHLKDDVTSRWPEAGSHVGPAWKKNEGRWE